MSAAPEPGTEDPPARRRHHPLRWVLGGLAALVAVAAAAVVVSYLVRDRAEPKSIDRAVDDFRQGAAEPTPDAADERLPAEGVYELVGSGGQEISFPPLSEADGTTMPGSVEHLDGNCFRWRVDYNDAHWHQWDFCRDGDDLLLGPQRNYLRWDFGSVAAENIGDFSCDPPQRYPIGSPPGTVTTATCTGTNTAVSGASTTTDRTEVVGTEDLDIGGEDVAAVHLRQEDQLTGAQTGANTVEWWFEPRTGLPLRVARTYRLDTASPVGSITYTEEGQWQVTSLEPRR